MLQCFGIGAFLKLKFQERRCLLNLLGNIKKTYYYARKNGICEAYYAIREQAYAKKSPDYLGNSYQFTEINDEEYEKQKNTNFKVEPLISILVPTYETNSKFLKEMIQSVMNQSYGKWELILADASKTEMVKLCLDEFMIRKSKWEEKNNNNIPVRKNCRIWSNRVSLNSRIVYCKLEENRGISENSNEALALAMGDYIGLLDHDDLLCRNALYEMVLTLNNNIQDGKEVAFLYSDEDKCDTEGKKFYDPNIKLEFNFDYLLSNNYICHLLLMRKDLIKQLGFRKEYDGAQDFDLIIRASIQSLQNDLARIVHVDKVLYHWRCHEGSTASNPLSKMYAYEAGRKAVIDGLYHYLLSRGEVVQKCNNENGDPDTDSFYANGIKIRVHHTKHNGFYRVQYGNGSARELFLVRKDIAALAYSRIVNNKITNGIKNQMGNTLYQGLPKKVSGYLHRAVLQQDVYSVDCRFAILRPELQAYEKKGYITMDDFKQEASHYILYDPLYQIID